MKNSDIKKLISQYKETIIKQKRKMQIVSGYLKNSKKQNIDTITRQEEH